MQQEEFSLGLDAEVSEASSLIPYKWQRRILFSQSRSGENIPKWLLTPIDYSFRPTSYWTPENLRQLVANIKGAERKKAALRLIRQSRLDEAASFILADSLSSAERTEQGEIHPALLGGEYLPDYGAGEVEIARISMASVTQDVISLRAFSDPESRRIRYRVVDEYQRDFETTPASSDRPLSLRQLIRLIETAKCSDYESVGLGIIQIQVDCADVAPESLVDFLSFSSEFYPDLPKHFWFAVQRWVEHNRRAAR